MAPPYAFERERPVEKGHFTPVTSVDLTLTVALLSARNAFGSPILVRYVE